MERATTALAALQALANRIGRVKSEDPTGRQFKTEDQQVKTEDEDAEAAGGEPHAACGAGSAGWQVRVLCEVCFLRACVRACLRAGCFCRV